MKTKSASITLIILVLFLGIINPVFSQETIEIYPNLHSQKNLKLCADIGGSFFANRMELVESVIERYEVDIIKSHIRSDSYLEFLGYEELGIKPDQAFINQYRNYYKHLKDKGVYLILGGTEPVVPHNLLTTYPAMRDIKNQKFWEFIENKTSELFDVIPEMDCFYLYLWETPMINDAGQFVEFRERNYGFSYPYYSQSDYFKHLLDAYSRAAYSKGKDFMLMTFNHYPDQEQIMIEALKKRDRNCPYMLHHKNHAGDFGLPKPVNNIMLEITDMPGQIIFDGAGEYWGNSLTPYCYPEEIQAHVQNALAHNHSINTLAMRTNWGDNTLFGTPNEINFYTLYRLAKDPFTPIEQIWNDWAVERYGKEASVKVISALKRSDDIGKRIFYVDGMRVFDHSRFIKSLAYIESRAINYSLAKSRWKPYDVMGNYRMNELLNYPRENWIKEIQSDRDEALAMIALSLKDIEDVKKALKPEDYNMLIEQFTRLRDMAKASKLQLEVFFRYRIEKLGALEKGEENRRKLELCLKDMEKMAVEIEKENRGFLLLEPAMMRKYTNDIKIEVNKYN